MSSRREKWRTRGTAPAFALAAAKHYAGEIRRYFNRRLGRVHDVNDLAQEVYFRLLRIDPDMKVENPLAFVYGVARRVLADHRAEAAADDGMLTFESDLTSGVNHASEALGDRPEERVRIEQDILRALSQIPPMHAAILILHKRDGLSYEEVAAELGISVHTVKKYLTEARARIRMQRWDV